MKKRFFIIFIFIAILFFIILIFTEDINKTFEYLIDVDYILALVSLMLINKYLEQTHYLTYKILTMLSFLSALFGSNLFYLWNKNIIVQIILSLSWLFNILYVFYMIFIGVHNDKFANYFVYESRAISWIIYKMPFLIKDHGYNYRKYRIKYLTTIISHESENIDANKNELNKNKKILKSISKVSS